MAHSPPSRGRGRERLVLAVGLVSTLALLWAAFAAYGEPRRAGEAELARRMGEFADAVVAEWDRLRRNPWPFADEGEVLRLSETARLSPDDVPAPRDWLAMRDEPFPAFDVLLAEARRYEREEDDPAEALTVVLETLEKDCDPPRRAEARLRAIQLAARTERGDVAAAQWELLAAELEGWEARGDTSYLLLATLAAAPHLIPEQRRTARTRLVDLWVASRLALPGPISDAGAGDLEALRHPSLPLRDRLRELVQALAEEPDPRLLAAERVHLTRLVARVCGPLAKPTVRGTWGVKRLDGGTLAYRPSPAEAGLVEVVPLRGNPAVDRLFEAVSRSGIVADGYSLEIGLESIDQPPDPPPGVAPEEYLPPTPWVREPALLPDSDLEFVVSHQDPDSVRSAAAQRVRLLRAGLVLLALLTGAAAFTTARVLRRERTLAALKTSFVANVSHELRTPLSSILLMAENLERRLVTKEETQQRYHGLIRREAQRLRRLVDDVLDFSRLDRGEALRLRIEDVELAGFARDLEQEARERATAGKVELACTTEDLPATARFDVEALRRAVLNLVDNAVKHAGAGRIDVMLSGAGGGLRIGVADDGAGIDAARREEVFSPFARLDEGPTPNGAPGAGLGLAIVREIAVAHGGTARCVDPGPDHGARFEIVLPPAATDAKMEGA